MNRAKVLQWAVLAALLLGAAAYAGWLSPWSGLLAERLPELLEELPSYLGGHLALSVAALAVGLAVSIPLGVYVSNRPRAAEWALGVAGVLQTIPSLALLALMVPLLGGLIGFWPAFVAMTLYSLLPILKNTVTGLQGTDPALVEAARGLGMTDRQVLFKVKLPLASPVILAGVRVATVLVVGSATLATPVGYRTLGNYIFEGLNTRDHLMVIFGCVIAAALALLFDQLIRVLEVASLRRSGVVTAAGTAGLLLLVAGGLAPAADRVINPPRNPLVLGTHDHSEQYILGQLLRQRLAEAGFDVDWRRGMAQKVTLDAVRSGEVDVCVDYTGNIWTANMKRTDAAPPAETLREVARWLADDAGVECVGPVGFQNAYALAMREQDAARLGVRTLADLRPHAGLMEIAGDMQFFGVPEWKRVQEKYGLKFKTTRPMDQTLTYGAVQSGRVEVIVAYTSDGRVNAYNLRVLDDPQQAFPPYDAVLLISEKARNRPGLRKALRPLVGAIDLGRMRRANERVDIGRESPRKVGVELHEALR